MNQAHRWALSRAIQNLVRIYLFGFSAALAEKIPTYAINVWQRGSYVVL